MWYAIYRKINWLGDSMRRIYALFLFISLLFTITGCHTNKAEPQICATTLPVYEFTSYLCAGTDIKVNRLITENVSCLHDYTLQAKHMRMIEESDLVVISGAGLEDFLSEPLKKARIVVDSSAGIETDCTAIMHEHHHSHTEDPHIWLSPAKAKEMAKRIYTNLLNYYPDHADIFNSNYQTLSKKFDELIMYADNELQTLSGSKIVTFHDGFHYLADTYDLNILKSIEEESGSEASAMMLIELIKLINTHNVNAIFVERNGSSSAASIISAETGVPVYELDMGLSGDSYFTAMYHNINTLKEALK